MWVPTDQDVFLALRFCLNGTGGCHEEYLRFAGGRWHVLDQPFAKELLRTAAARSLAPQGPATRPGYPYGGVAGIRSRRCELPSLVGNALSLRLVGDALTLLDAGPLRPTPAR